MKAFPLNVASQFAVEYGGMDLRDYFAAKAMQAYLSLNEVHIAVETEEFGVDELVDTWYRIADKMIERREIKND